MKIPRPEFLVYLMKIIKMVRETRLPHIRQNFPFHLAVFFIFLLCLLLFMTDRERVVRAAPISETLWGVSQVCDFEIQNPQNSIDRFRETFDDQTASCTGKFAADKKMWLYTEFQPTSLAYIERVRLEVRFFMTGLQDDHVKLEIFDGNQWRVLQNYGGNKKEPPTALETLGFDVSTYLDSPEKINQVTFRIKGTKELGHVDEVTIVMDGARLIVTGVNEPTDTPTPTVLPTASPTDTPKPSLIPSSAPISITPTPLEISPTPEITPVPPGSKDLQYLWGLGQECGYEITNSEMGLDQRFDDQTASCTGEFAADKKAWRYTDFQNTSVLQVKNVLLETRFSVVGLVDDRINLEISDGNHWHVLQRFDRKTSRPPTGLFTNVYDVSNILDSPGKVNLVSVRFVGKVNLFQPDTITISLDGMRLVIASGPEGTATPTVTEMPTLTPSPSSTPPFFQTTPTTTMRTRSFEQTLALLTPTIPLNVAAAPRLPGDPHGDNSGVTDSCSGCHTSHAASGTELRQSLPEESVCYSCHASGDTGTNVETVFSSYTNTLTSFFKHDVGMTNGVHRRNQSSGADFGGGNRHIECEDCHEPHYAARGDTNPPMLQLEMMGISGVEPVWAGSGAPVSFTLLTEADREHQVCFKCHSSYTILPSFSPDGWNGNSYVTNGLPKLTSSNPLQVPDQRDLARAFNPNQASYHPVVALGRNQNIPANTFVAGWSQSSMVYCTDCHDNANSSTQANGPHGSPRLHILKGQANYSTVFQSPSPRVSDQEICFICHNYQAYVTGEIETSNFKEHKKHMNEDWGTTCYTCHNSHGSEQLHLINFDASVVTFLNGANSQSAWYDASANGKAGCSLICHGDVHDPEEYGPG